MSDQNNEVKIEDLHKLLKGLSEAFDKSQLKQDMKVISEAFTELSKSPEMLKIKQEFNTSTLDFKKANDNFKAMSELDLTKFLK